MKTLGQFKGLFAVIIVGGIAILMGMVIGSSYTSNNLVADDTQTFAGSQTYLNPATGHSPFVAVSQKVKPAVVNISAKSIIEERYHDFMDDDFWRRFFGMPPNQPNQNNKPRKRRSESLGSGFFISSDGYILTNNHVVRDADDIIVRLSDAKEYKAEIIGADSETDVALIKIDVDEKMSYLELGNSDSILVGDWVIAVGNPFPQLGLDRTVTVGVVSALGRSGLVFGQNNPIYQNYIQTDASINPGNSGGPLVNINGRVIGINSAIVSPTGGNIGIGFAVPINLASKIAEQLKDSGIIARGWLGILPGDIDNNMAEALDLSSTNGVLVESVESGSPAEDGGLKVGDVIIEVDGKKIIDAQHFRFIIADSGPNKKISMKIIRDNKNKSLKFTLGDRSKYLNMASTGEADKTDSKWLGISVTAFTEQMANRMSIDFEPGVIIESVETGSPADDAQVLVNDIIIEIDHKPVESKSDFLDIAEQLKNREKSILFLIKRGNRTFHKAIKP
ncbi:MAG: Do family serine endopeptidase [candidate division Zixibacteria bacterium]|nr:Do family serine endopeptidase [candidate division Zixibacteria bacterium]